MKIHIDTSELKKLGSISTQKQFERGFQVAQAGYLNDVAFAVRKETPDAMKSDGMIIRNNGFVRKHNLVKMAKASYPMSAQYSEVYTTRGDRSTGWIEQPTGGPDKRDRKWTSEGRTGNSKRGKVREKLRFKSGRKIDRFDRGYLRIKNMTVGQQVSIWTRKRANSPRKLLPFLIKDVDGLPDGVYFLNASGKLRFAAHTNKDRRVRKVNFQESAARKVIRSGIPQTAFVARVQFQIRRRLKKL